MIWDLGLSACGLGVSIRCSLFFVQYLSRKSKRHTPRRAWANIQGGERHRVSVSRAHGVRGEGRACGVGVGVRCSVFLCLNDKEMGVGCWVLRVLCSVSKSAVKTSQTPSCMGTNTRGWVFCV